MRTGTGMRQHRVREAARQDRVTLGTGTGGMEDSALWVITVEPCFADSPEGKVAAVTVLCAGQGSGEAPSGEI